MKYKINHNIKMHDSKVSGMGHWGWSDLCGWKSTIPNFAEAICTSFAEAIFKMLRLYALFR